MPLFSGSGLTPSLKGVTSNVVALKAGQVQILYPAGWYAVSAGLYTTIQQQDPITQIWRNIGGGSTRAGIEYIYSDGTSYRLANQNGCIVGAAITNVGSGYTSAPTVTASAGGAIFKAIVGGAVSQTVTVTNGGTNYTYAPSVQFSVPPAGGVQATGYCTLTSGVVTSVTVVDQGAGYASAPTIVFTNDPREGINGNTTGYNAAAVATLTGSGTITAILCLDHGNPIAFTANSATSLPTLSFAGGGGSSAAASPIMNWSINSIVSSGYNAGAGITATAAQITGMEVVNGTVNSTVLNPTIQRGLVRLRQAVIYNATTGSALGAYNTATTVFDGGCYTGTPLPAITLSASTTVTTAPVVTFCMGYNNDVSYMTQF